MSSAINGFPSDIIRSSSLSSVPDLPMLQKANDAAFSVIATQQARIRQLEQEISNERLSSAQSMQGMEDQLSTERKVLVETREELRLARNEIETLLLESQTRLDQVRGLQDQVKADTQEKRLLEEQVNALRGQTEALTKQIEQGQTQIKLLQAHLEAERGKVVVIGARVDRLAQVVLDQQRTIQTLSQNPPTPQWQKNLWWFYDNTVGGFIKDGLEAWGLKEKSSF